MPIDRELLGKSIRRVRQLRGISQAKLADKAGLRGNSVALVERGERGVSMETLNDLADALDIPAACLTMLGMSKISGLRHSVPLVRSMQKLILATITAEEKLLAQEAAKGGRRRRAGRKPKAKTTKSRVEKRRGAKRAQPA